jgi:RNA polymerase sigma-70 factor (ECF subfamily)
LPEDLDLRRLLEDCLRSGSQSAWTTFVSQFHRVIQAAIFRTSRRCSILSPGLAEDLIQEVYLRLFANDCKVLREFRSSEPKALYGLIQAVAVTVTLDHFRSWSAEKRGSGQEQVSPDSETIQIPSLGSPEEEIARSLLLERIDRCLKEIIPAETADRDRRVFWFYFRHGFTAREIAALPGTGLSDKGVESLLHRLTHQLKPCVKEKGTSA